MEPQDEKWTGKPKGQRVESLWASEQARFPKQESRLVLDVPHHTNYPHKQHNPHKLGVELKPTTAPELHFWIRPKKVSVSMATLRQGWGP